MNQKIVATIILALALVVGIFGVLSEPGIFGLGCTNNGVLCNNPLTPIPGEPFLAISASLLVSIALFFVRREVFIVWAKFAAVAFPLMLGIMLYTYNDAPMRSGFGLSGLISNEQFATAILPPLFFLVSLIIISVKSLRLRKSSIT